MASLFRAYNAALIRRPMIAQSGTAAFLFGAGDLIAQQAVEKKGLLGNDWLRTARLAFYGGALFGPLVTKWYQLLNRIRASNATKVMAYRVFLDQAVMAPAHIAFFFTTMTLLEGNGYSQVTDRLRQKYQMTLVRNWGLFIPAQIVNFTFVPSHLRFFFVGIVSLCWNTYLSTVNAPQAATQEKLVKLD